MTLEHAKYAPERTALMVVDVQEASVARGPWRGDEVVGNIGSLIAAARASGVHVVYVQHDGQPGDEDEAGLPGWEIHAAIRPRDDERVVRKSHNSAFRGTDLETWLRSRGLETLVVVGIQTEYCVDTTCRVAYELGFDVVVPEMANTTFDNGPVEAGQIHQLVNRRILDDRFARVVSVSDCLRLLDTSMHPSS